jgi:hypothetical protein
VQLTPEVAAVRVLDAQPGSSAAAPGSLEAGQEAVAEGQIRLLISALARV